MSEFYENKVFDSSTDDYGKFVAEHTDYNDKEQEESDSVTTDDNLALEDHFIYTIEEGTQTVQNCQVIGLERK